MNEADFRFYTALASAISLAIQIVIPISVVFIGYILNRTIKSVEQAISQTQSLRLKRAELYDHMAAQLNAIFCACYLVGPWREQPPRQALVAKREVDRFFVESLPYWDADVCLAYR